MVIVNHGEEDHHECEDALDQRHGVGDGDPGDGVYISQYLCVFFITLQSMIS